MKNNKELKRYNKDTNQINFHKEVQTVNLNQMI